MNTETPETDTLFSPLWIKSTPLTDNELHEVTKSHRRLERERDLARAEAERWRDNWNNSRTMSMIFGTDLPWENAENNRSK